MIVLRDRNENKSGKLPTSCRATRRLSIMSDRQQGPAQSSLSPAVGVATQVRGDLHRAGRGRPARPIPSFRPFGPSRRDGQRRAARGRAWTARRAATQRGREAARRQDGRAAGPSQPGPGQPGRRNGRHRSASPTWRAGPGGKGMDRRNSGPGRRAGLGRRDIGVMTCPKNIKGPAGAARVGHQWGRRRWPAWRGQGWQGCAGCAGPPRRVGLALAARGHSASARAE